MKSFNKAEAFEHDEDAVSRVVGMARHHLLILRYKHLIPQVDWDVVGGRVLLTKKGVQKLLEAAGLKMAEEGGEGRLNLKAVLEGSSHRLDQKKGEIRVRVLASRGTNTEIVTGMNMTSKNPGEIVTVAVGDNRNFVVGMEFLAKPLEGMGANVYTLAEARPREKGRW